jgi:hypothetical protein
VLDNLRGYRTKIKFLGKEKENVDLTPVSFIISVNYSYAASGTPATNVKRHISKGKRFVSVSRKYLENFCFKLSKCTSVLESMSAFYQLFCMGVKLGL